MSIPLEYNGMNEINGNYETDIIKMNVDIEQKQNSHNQQNPENHSNGINTENFEESIYNMSAS